MIDEKIEKKSINWGAIILALVAITAGRFIWAAVRGDLRQEKPNGIVTAEELAIDFSSQPIKIDIYNDGGIIVDGAAKNAEEMKALIPEWKAARKLISYYREPRSDNTTPEADAAGEAIFGARLSFSPRKEPQPGEKAAAPNP
jgi:hypothetical protein